MAGIAIIISAIAGLIAIVFAGVAIFFWAYAVEEVKQENDYSLPPFEPEFNEDDNDSCQELINGFYNDAVSAFFAIFRQQICAHKPIEDGIVERIDAGIRGAQNSTFRSLVGIVERRKAEVDASRLSSQSFALIQTDETGF